MADFPSFDVKKYNDFKATIHSKRLQLKTTTPNSLAYKNRVEAIENLKEESKEYLKDYFEQVFLRIKDISKFNYHTFMEVVKEHYDRDTCIVLEDALLNNESVFYKAFYNVM